MAGADESRVATRLPRLDEAAPDFEANTTFGPIKLSDYRGRWVLLFSHPADFTPVCTTEFIAFARRAEEFKALRCELLGLSIDSNYSHLAWLQNIKDHFGVTVPFPVIEDLTMSVARRYGMVQPGASDTHAVRTVFAIDPDGVLRAMVYYPMTVGRSVDELLRLVVALQTVDKHAVATPEGWRPGDKVVLPPPTTAKDAAARTAGSDACVDWYYCEKEL